MATIRDIEIGNSYRGDPILGGKYSQGVTIDSTPLQKLATFAYYRDRDFWMKKVAEDKAAAKEIADLTAYDIGSPMKEYTDYLIAKKNEAKDFLEKNPNALYFDRDRKGYQKFHEIVSEFDRARKAANTSDTIYNARKQTIDTLPEGTKKEFRKIELENSVKKLFKNGIEYALNNPLASSEEINPDTYEIPDLAITERVFVVNDKNGTEISKVEFGDLDNLDAQAAGTWFGLKKELDVTTEAFKKLSEDEQRLAIARDKVLHEKRIGIQSTANTFNGMLATIKKANPDVKIENVSTDGLPETIRENIISTNEFNRQVGELNRLTGQKYKRINLDDGLSGEEVIALQWFQKNGKTLYSEGPKKIQESEQHRMEIARGNLAVKLAELDLNKDKFDLEQKKFEKEVTGTEDGVSAALAFANGLFADLTNLASVKGTLPNGSRGVVLTPTDIRKMTQEQLKYLGVEKPIKDPITGEMSKVMLDPLTLGETDAIQIDSDGTLRVLKDASFNPKTNRWTGKWDATRSTSVWNAARNVLNEENAKSGTKERNAYTPIDVRGQKGEIHVDSGGGKTKTTTTEKTKTSTYTAQMPDGKIITSTDGKIWYYSDGKKVQ